MMTTQTTTAATTTTTVHSVQRVALVEGVDARVERLRGLAHQITTDAFTFAEALLREHDAELWQGARTPDGDHFPSEETFWEGALHIRRRTGFQLLARGKTLRTLELPADDRAALASVGLAKFDIIAPALIKEPTVEATQRWIAAAQTCSRDELREQVNRALGRTTRKHNPGERLRRYVVEAMPDLATRQLAEDFFETGTAYVETNSPLAVLIAAMQEALGTWRAHTVATPTDVDSCDGAA